MQLGADIVLVYVYGQSQVTGEDDSLTTTGMQQKT